VSQFDCGGSLLSIEQLTFNRDHPSVQGRSVCWTANSRRSAQHWQHVTLKAVGSIHKNFQSNFGYITCDQKFRRRNAPVTLKAGSMLLADWDYNADWIRTFVQRLGAWGVFHRQKSDRDALL
jgi:hypothetical protein